MSHTTRIFVVDDDENICRALKRTLRQAGYEIRYSDNSAALYRAATEWDPELVILDVRLGMEDGREVARNFRAMHDIPVLMLTGQSSVADRITGLDSGADDYLTKPFDNGELIARVRALLRRPLLASRQKADIGSPVRVDSERRVIIAPSGTSEPLTELQTSIMTVLLERAGHVVSREDIYSLVFRRPWEPNDRSLEVHISHLRKIIARVEPERIQIQSVRNVGYRLVVT